MKKNYLPTLRRDVNVIPIANGQDQVLYFSDPLVLSSNALFLPIEYSDLIPLFYTGFKINDVLAQFPTSERPQLKTLLQSLSLLLDEYYLVDSERFKHKMEEIESSFEQSSVRPATLAGSAYPSTKDEITKKFESIFEPFTSLKNDAHSDDDSLASVYALYAPHIDIRVAEEAYGESFAKIAHLRPEHVYIIGTSHYAGYYPSYDDTPIIFSEKDFQTPLGIVPNNHPKTKMLYDGTGTGSTTADRAHRIEHSIEIQLIFLQYLWSHPFTITPVLIGSLDELLYSNLSEKSTAVENFSKTLHQNKESNDLILISGDLSHIGRKFGDESPGMLMYEDVQKYDNLTLKAASSGDAELFLSHIQSNHDAYRVCGYPPLFTFLKQLPEHIKGDTFANRFWDDSETESIVSFGSLLFKDKR